MTPTIDANPHIEALLASGLTTDEISEMAMESTVRKARETSMACMPDGENPAEVLAWLIDGNGNPNVQAELVLMVDALLADDLAWWNHARQALKNALIALPHILQQAEQRKAERDGTVSKDPRPSGAALDEAIRKHKESQQ